MKKSLLILLFALVVSYLGWGQVTLPHLDAINYTVGQGLQTQTGWTTLNSGDNLLIASGSLAYPGLETPNFNKVSFDGGGIDAAKLFTQQTAGTVYYSFLLNVTALGSLGTAGGYFTGFTEGTGSTFGATVWSRADGVGYDLGINPRTTVANTVWSTGTTSINTTLFVVISYQIISGTTNDIVKMWINPTPGASEPSPTMTATNTLVDLANVNRILVRQDATANTPFIEMDELRIGTSWADVTPAAAANQIDWANLQWPGSGTITLGDNFNVYAQVFEPGVTDATGQGAGITAWIGYSNTNSDPSTWTNWITTTFQGDAGTNNDEYTANLGAALVSSGTFYYASRFKLGTAPYVYGGFNGGFWNGTTNVSGVLTVNAPTAQIDWCNLQWPGSGTITLGGAYNVYAQVYEPGVTNSGGQGAGITAWIGFSTSPTDPPSMWTNWVAATFNTDAGNNDEYMANIGSVIPSGGTYYYASRFKLGLSDYVYGGFSGGFWDGTNNISGVLTVNVPFIIINEVDADNPGTDAAEFVELYDGGVGNTGLTGFVVVFYNGSNDLSYASYDLDGYSTDANGYFVLGNSGVAGVDLVFEGNFLQNGQDAVALYSANGANFPNNTPVTTSNLIDAIVYDTDDADDTGLLILLNSGQPQVNENGMLNMLNHSSQRIPNGSGGQRNTNTYYQTYPTPDAANFIYTANWTGTTSSDWSILTNWSNGIIPDAGTNANIPDVANDPILATTAICKDLSMETLSKLDIASSGKLTVSGTFTNNGNLTIKSDATGTGSLIENNGVSATVERYLTVNEWHYVSAPVNDPLAGVFLGMYMLQWDEPTGAFTYITDENYPLTTDMEGFAIWTYDPETVVFTGNLNTGSKSILATNTMAAPHNNKSFNFVGNPYPSAVDWDLASGWTKTNIANAIYIWLQQDIYGGQYGTYIGGVSLGIDNIIAPHQGFFVAVSPGFSTGTLEVNNNARIHTTTDIYKTEEAISDILKIKVNGNNYYDEIALHIDPLASVNTDQLDAAKFRGSAVAPQLYSISKDNEELSINSFPVQDDYMVIPVGLEVGADAVYTISVSDFAGFEFSSGIYLEDLKEGIFTKLEGNATYSFNANPLDEPMRFLLHMSSELAVPENNVGLSGVQVYSFNSDVYVTSVNGLSGKVMIYDLLGREIMNGKLSGETMKKFDLSGHQGYMVVKVAGESGNLNQKVYIR